MVMGPLVISPSVTAPAQLDTSSANVITTKLSKLRNFCMWVSFLTDINFINLTADYNREMIVYIISNIGAT